MVKQIDPTLQLSETDKQRAACVLLDVAGITFVFNYDINRLGYMPGANVFPDAFNYPVRLPGDISKVSKLDAAAMIDNGLEQFGRVIAARKRRQELGRRLLAPAIRKKFAAKSVAERSEIMRLVAANSRR